MSTTAHIRAKESNMAASLPEIGFVRLAQIVGNPKAKPPVPPMIPISASSWWNGVRSGKYPQPLKFGPKTTLWRAQDIRALIEAGTPGPKGTR